MPKYQKTNYQRKLDDPRWQKKRLEVLERHGWCCLECGDKDSMLHVHHKYYCSHRDPWEYPMSAFVALCKKCHEDIKDAPEIIQPFEDMMTWMTSEGLANLAGMLHDLHLEYSKSGKYGFEAEEDFLLGVNKFVGDALYKLSEDRISRS